ncbi:MAG: cation diffusion facilitator family transporter [Dehalococcoidia bacterium]|nr:cation diffusion facilitator family transporter [Dehalococcoidia bacterium]
MGRRIADLQKTKERVSRVSITTISLLIAMKVVAAILTGSIGILADAVHSLIDLTGAIVGFFAVKVSGRPPDEDHRFGHGRAEDLAGAVIAGLIFSAGGMIAYQAVRRLMAGSIVDMVDAGIITTAAAIAINVAVSRYVFTVARAADSVALEATGRDLMADVLSSVAVLVGLVLVRVTGQAVLDPIVALIVVVFIVRAAVVTMREAVTALMDTRLPEEEESLIRKLLDERQEVANYHSLRTRKAGSQRHVVVHIVVPSEKTVEEGHRIAEEMEDEIRKLLRNATVTIHVEPCTPDCAECPAQCQAARDRANLML